MKTDSVCGLVVAAGLSSRTPTFNKLTYKIGGKPMVWYAVHHLRTAGIGRILTVVGHDRINVMQAIGDHVEWVVQEQQHGTAHAAAQAIPQLADSSTIVVLFGDCPFLDSEIIGATLDRHQESNAELTIATAQIKDPRALGQVRRGADNVVAEILDGRLGQLTAPFVAEVFAGLSIWNADALRDVVPRLPLVTLPSGRREQNLPDAVKLMRAENRKVEVYGEVPERDAIAPNEPLDFDLAGSYLRIKVRTRLLVGGVEFEDPETVVVDHDVVVGEGSRITRNVDLRGSTKIGTGCLIGPDTSLRDCVVDKDCVIGRGSWEKHYFAPGARVSDSLAGKRLYFATPHFHIPAEPDFCFAIFPFHQPYQSRFEHIIKPIVQSNGLRYGTAEQAELGVITDYNLGSDQSCGSNSRRNLRRQSERLVRVWLGARTQQERHYAAAGG